MNGFSLFFQEIELEDYRKLFKHRFKNRETAWTAGDLRYLFVSDYLFTSLSGLYFEKNQRMADILPFLGLRHVCCPYRMRFHRLSGM